jgi:hypothetical protein
MKSLAEPVDFMVKLQRNGNSTATLVSPEI